jgi:hypothetical protein
MSPVYTEVFKMEIQNILRKRRRKTKHITIRVDSDVSRWLKRKNYSPTAIFNEAIKELGYRRKRRPRY